MVLVDVAKMFTFDEYQMKTFLILGIICAAAVLFCFICGQLTKNYSQMDKLWSILPIAYVWVIFGRYPGNWRCLVIAILVTLWGVRLTYNFAKKGAYKLKFWEGKEDYRWKIVKASNFFKNNEVKWTIFNLLFISLFQNIVVMGITVPSLVIGPTVTSFMWFDGIAIFVTAGALIYETIADAQQMKFQNTKWKMIGEGKKLEDLPAPYNLGFNTVGLWKRSRHPNYIGEQLTWVGVYLFTIAAGYSIFNLSLIGVGLLVLIFVGSSRLAEAISSSKYPLYKDYQKKVFKYLPIKKYK